MSKIVAEIATSNKQTSTNMRPFPHNKRHPSKARGWRDWYQLGRWKRRHRLQLMAEPLCRFCRARGVATLATVADHVTPHRGDWNAFVVGPLQSLCGTCHNRDKRAIEAGQPLPTPIGLDGYPLPENPRTMGF